MIEKKKHETIKMGQKMTVVMEAKNKKRTLEQKVESFFFFFWWW